MPDNLGRSSSEFQQEYLFGKKFTDGYFRDVFRWNYLNPTHLENKIEGVPFRAWIEMPVQKKPWFGKQVTRGFLSYLDNGSAVWELTAQEAANVRPHMLKAGLLMVRS